uniref:Uncharacterized protein n=1 Tax=Arundo donax TaxID=35708 RepID=A0A0A9CKL7_ARUDO
MLEAVYLNVNQPSQTKKRRGSQTTEVPQFCSLTYVISAASWTNPK